MTVSLLFVAGRLLFAVPIVVWAVGRTLDDGATPAVKAWALASLAAASAVVLGLWGDVAALALAAALVGGGVADDPGPVDGDGQRLERDDRRALFVGLLGGAVCIAALFVAVGAAIDLTLTDPVLDLDLR